MKLVRESDRQKLYAAARPDDAEVEAGDWDKWLVSTSVCPYCKENLVCRGDYDEDNHGPLYHGMWKQLEKMCEDGLLKGTEIFFCTDNFTSEAAFFNGSSKSEKLFKHSSWIHCSDGTVLRRLDFNSCLGDHHHYCIEDA